MKTSLFSIIAWLLIFVLYSVSDASEIGWQDCGKGGAVAAGKAPAVAAGISILEQGGNAADAAAATLLALTVTDYGSCTIGAEIPVILYDNDSKKVKVLCGLGSAPLDPNAITWFYKNGIPDKGSIKAAPVPGALSLCMTLLKLYGTMSFEQVLVPAMAILDKHKVDWHEKLAATFRKLIETEKKIHLKQGSAYFYENNF